MPVDFLIRADICALVPFVLYKMCRLIVGITNEEEWVQ